MTLHRGIKDVTGEWPLILREMSNASPYHTASWGGGIAQHFGGTFRVLQLRVAESMAHMPILVGGSLAAPGFVCGHVGYGGLLSETEDNFSIAYTEGAIAAVEDFLGLPCTRYVSAPRQGQPKERSFPSVESRQTEVVSLYRDGQAIWDGYAGRARTAIKGCLNAGAQSFVITAGSSFHNAEDLIRSTQERVGANYRIPYGLIDSVNKLDQDSIRVFACKWEGVLVSVGVFLLHRDRAAYFANGYVRGLPFNPNYLLMHRSALALAADGVRTLDLGYSHYESLHFFKKAWGGSTQDFYMLRNYKLPRTTGIEGTN